MNGHPENLLLSYAPRYCLPSQSAGATHRATSHTRLRLLVAGAVVACLALPTRQAPAQPARELNPQRSAPPSRDGSHDFDFLEGAWQLSDAPADYHTLGPYGRLVVRIVAPRTATVEWYTREPDPAPDSGFMRMSYDPASNQWMIHEAVSQTASPGPPLVGSFEHGIGSFIGPRKRDGRLVLARLTWTFNGLGNERLEWAFSADSGTTWKTQRALGLSRVSTSPARRSAFEGTCCPRVEVVWYSVPAGKDEQLIDLFARESRAMGDSIRVQDVALFRDADRRGVFALVRGFDRERPTDDYYRGPAWTAHRAALDRAGIRVDSLIELMADRRPWGFIVGERAAADMPAKARGLVVATVYTLDQHRPDYFYFSAFFVQSVAPRIVASGARLLAVFTSEDWGFVQWTGQRDASAIPGRPINPQRMSFVSFTWFADSASYRRHLKALEADEFWRQSVMPDLTRFLAERPATWRLVPVGRSRELRDWRETPQ